MIPTIKAGNVEVKEIFRHSLNLNPLDFLNKVVNFSINDVVNKKIKKDTIELAKEEMYPSFLMFDK